MNIPTNISKYMIDLAIKYPELNFDGFKFWNSGSYWTIDFSKTDKYMICAHDREIIKRTFTDSSLTLQQVKRIIKKYIVIPAEKGLENKLSDMVGKQVKLYNSGNCELYPDNILTLSEVVRTENGRVYGWVDMPDTRNRKDGSIVNYTSSTMKDLTEYTIVLA